VYPSQEQQLKENVEPWRLVLNRALSEVEGKVKGLALKVVEEAAKVIARWL
jgi:hypothetical protein